MSKWQTINNKKRVWEKLFYRKIQIALKKQAIDGFKTFKGTNEITFNPEFIEKVFIDLYIFNLLLFQMYYLKNYQMCLLTLGSVILPPFLLCLALWITPCCFLVFVLSYKYVNKVIHTLDACLSNSQFY